MATKNNSLVKLPNGKMWLRPPTRSCTIDLGNGRVAAVTISFAMGTIPAKLYCLGRVVRQEDGKPRTMNVRVPAVTVKCKVSGKSNAGEIKANSFCKPPDQFCAQIGTHLAVKHLFRRDKETSNILNGSDRRAVLEAVCPWLMSNGLKPKMQKSTKTAK